MEFSIYIEIIVLILLLLLSAFFSGSETAFFSIPASRLKKLREDKKRDSQRVAKLLNTPRRLLITILTGNTIVNIAIATMAALLALSISRKAGFNRTITIIVEIVVITFVILVISEISPKIIAVKNSVQFSKLVSLPLLVVFRILHPFAALLYALVKFISETVGIRRKTVILSQEEIKTLVELGEEKGTLEVKEKEMLHSIMELGETYVKEIMVPRTDMAVVSTEDTIRDVIDIIRTKGFSRIPLYERNIDDIKGIIFAKDVLPFVRTSVKEVKLMKIARSVYFVPEKMLINELLREFQRQKTNIAIVVDEYGGTSGLVTLEDVIEEIIGEIRDEYDRELPLVKKVKENRFLIDARVGLDDLNKILSIDLPTEEDFDSLGGFLYSLLGDIPAEKERINYGNLEFIIERVEGRRISKVLMVKKENADESE
ncbi:MAG: hemolysin family protein [Fidelibacterota bacterium]